MAQRTHANLYIGVDGGATHTRALLAQHTASDEWDILGRGVSGPSNINTAGAETALSNIHHAVRSAFHIANRAWCPVTAACFGIASGEEPHNHERIIEWLEKIKLAEHYEVINDAEIVLADGTPNNWGVAVIAGTGSSVFGKSPKGKTVWLGGWDYIVEDAGSARKIALEGIRAVTGAHDGYREKTKLTERLLKVMGIGKVQEIKKKIHDPEYDIAGLAPAILAVAEEGDTVARLVVAREIRNLAQTTLTAMGEIKEGEKAVPLALAGSVLLKNEWYKERFLGMLDTVDIKACPVEPVPEPVKGALKRALMLAS